METHDAIIPIDSSHRYVPRPEDTQTGHEATLQTEPSIHQRFKLTQLGDAERLIQRHGDRIRYCYPWKRWLAWDGCRWRIDDTGQIDRLAQQTVRSIYGEALHSGDTVVRDAIFGHAKRSETRTAIDAMISLARSQAGVPVLPGELDRDPFRFNCLNGTLDLRTGELGKHNRGDLITKLAPVSYDPRADCPVWQAFLNRIFAGDDLLIGYLQRVLGLALTGSVTDKALFVLHGTGDNGKTTLLEAVRFVMGDYAGVVDIDVLMQGSDTAARERATAELLGKRFVTSSETEEGHRFNEAKIKHLTGMGRLTARRIYGSPFEYDPMFKLFIDANHKPVIRGSDIAIWNRIRLIPFGVSIPKAEQDKELGAKLRAEAPGLLAWAVEGCLKWRAKGLREPETVSNAGEQYREEMDIVADFLADCCVVDAEAEVAVGDLYKAYRSWCEGLHEEAISDSAFGKRLTVKNFPLQRTSLVRLRKGLRLRSPEDSIHAEQAESQLAA